MQGISKIDHKESQSSCRFSLCFSTSLRLIKFFKVDSWNKVSTRDVFQDRHQVENWVFQSLLVYVVVQVVELLEYIV
jgi:hypothetical protein